MAQDTNSYPFVQGSPQVAQGAGQPQPPAQVMPTPSRGFTPKVPKVVFIVLGVILIGVIGFLAFKFLLPGITGPKEVTLTWWGLWEDPSVVNPIIDEYKQSHPKVTIDYQLQSKEDYRERLASKLAKGEGPDIFLFHNTWVPMFRNDLSEIPQEVMTPADFSQAYYRVITSDLVYGGAPLGVPVGYDGLGLYINEDLFASSGKTPPKDWNEFREVAQSLTRIANDQIEISGAAMGRVDNVDHWQEILALMLFQQGVDPKNPTGKLAKDVFDFYTYFASGDGKTWDVSLPSSTQAFAGGKVAMMFAPSWRVFEINAQPSHPNFRIVPVPQLPKENASEPDTTYASYWVVGVWGNGKNKVAAWDFVKFLSSRESLEKAYNVAAKTRLFGEPYPRTDMANLISENDPYAHAFIKQAASAKSWYLASRTFDGPTGINSQIGKYYEDAVNSFLAGSRGDDVLQTLRQGVTDVLGRYGLIQATVQ